MSQVLESLGYVVNYQEYRIRWLFLGTTHAFEKDNGKLTLIFFYFVWQKTALPKDVHLLIPRNCDYIRLHVNKKLRLQM